MEPPSSFLSSIRAALSMLICLSIITGMAYPALMTGLGRLLFPAKTGGSLIVRNGKVIGSQLIGQSFEDPTYFWGRPSATSPAPYNAAASSGSNLGPMNPALAKRVQERLVALSKLESDMRAVPVDLITASASGLDPHISPAAAYWQAPRIAKLRKLTEQQVNQLIERFTTKRSLGFLGEPVVNVLELNIALDQGAPLGGTAADQPRQNSAVALLSPHD